MTDQEDINKGQDSGATSSNDHTVQHTANATFDVNSIQQLAAGTFWRYLGGEVLEMSDDKVVVSLRIEPKHLNHLGILHGGVHAALLDSAMGLAAMAVRPGKRIVTIGLNLHYVSALKDGKCIVIAETVHETRSLITTQGRLCDEHDHLAAFATGTFRVLG